MTIETCNHGLPKACYCEDCNNEAEAEHDRQMEQMQMEQYYNEMAYNESMAQAEAEAMARYESGYFGG